MAESEVRVVRRDDSEMMAYWAIVGFYSAVVYYRQAQERTVRAAHRPGSVSWAQPWLNDEYVVVLQNGTELRLSRSYRETLEERLARA